MKIFTAFICLIILVFSSFAQKTNEILATATGKTFTVSSLNPKARQVWDNRQKLIAGERQELFARQATKLLFEQEAAARKIPVEKLIETEISAKIPEPTDAEIQAIYDANRAQLGNRTLAEARPQLVAFSAPQTGTGIDGKIRRGFENKTQTRFCKRRKFTEFETG